MADRVLRDHTEPCEDDADWYWEGTPERRIYLCNVSECPGGREVTAAEIQEMAYSLWQAEQMDEYHRDVL